MDKNAYIKQLLDDRLSYVEDEIKYYNYLLKSYLEDKDVEEYDYSDDIKTTEDTIREYEDEKAIIEDILEIKKSSSFEREIHLTTEDVDRLVTVIDEQEQTDMSYEKQNTKDKIKRGKELIKELF